MLSSFHVGLLRVELRTFPAFLSLLGTSLFFLFCILFVEFVRAEPTLGVGIEFIPLDFS